MSAVRTAGLMVLAGLLSACTLGPDYRQPHIATPTAYAEAATISQNATVAPLTLTHWWVLFKDPILSKLIDQALADNPDLQSAASRVREARLQEIVTRAAGYPSISAAANVVSVHTNHGSGPSASSSAGSGGAAGAASGGSSSSFSIPPKLNLFSLGFDASWEIDLFGGTRRATQAAKANTQAAIWAHRDAEVSLSAEVANDYLTLRVLQARITLAQAEVEKEKAQFTLIRQRRQTGFVTRLDVNRQTGAVESAAAQLPALQAQAEGKIHALGILLGRSPEDLKPRLNAATALPAAPPNLPLGLPSDLLRRRPDVREAEQRLAASNAQIGVQVASLYPKFNLMAIAGLAGDSLDSLFSTQNLLGAAVGMISQPLFDAGRRRASVSIAREQTAQAALAYRKVVLGALRDVEDALARYRSEQLRRASLLRSDDALKNSLTIAQDQYKTGFVTFLDVLQAQSALLKVQDQLTQSDGELLSDLVSLYKALGGGWAATQRP